jgi:hypothetical protein
VRKLLTFEKNRRPRRAGVFQFEGLFAPVPCRISLKPARFGLAIRRLVMA